MGDDFKQAIGITFFDVSFFIIITTIGLNIIFGIIVDTFSQLRDSKVSCVYIRGGNPSIRTLQSLTEAIHHWRCFFVKELFILINDSDRKIKITFFAASDWFYNKDQDLLFINKLVWLIGYWLSVIVNLWANFNAFSSLFPPWKNHKKSSKKERIVIVVNNNSRSENTMVLCDTYVFTS